MKYSDEEILKYARALKSKTKNPFESFWLTLFMLICYPIYFIPYEWEIYTTDISPDEEYIKACSRWQSIAIWWCIAVLFLIFDGLDPISGHSVYIFVKICLSTTFALYVFVIFVFGFMIDTIASRYKKNMIEFALKYKYIMGITIPVFALATVLITVAIVAFSYGLFYDSSPWAFYLSTFFVFAAQIAWFAIYALFVKDAWMPIQQAYDELQTKEVLSDNI